ncbi:hypothetical protein LNTAR_21745 [Lentisphaera araneosa HTCC2155]|uniref:Uncharacterized protein n=2 Tax=Lentisphaera TaxID=256846 RepID=A6DM83_9BACT|nr:hypothetical protein LNTAR_21745 [Lentisphaera araneosa HTCC2155]
MRTPLTKKTQIVIAIFILLLFGLSLKFKYSESNIKDFKKTWANTYLKKFFNINQVNSRKQFQLTDSMMGRTYCALKGSATVKSEKSLESFIKKLSSQKVNKIEVLNDKQLILHFVQREVHFFYPNAKSLRNQIMNRAQGYVYYFYVNEGAPILIFKSDETTFKIKSYFPWNNTVLEKGKP